MPGVRGVRVKPPRRHMDGSGWRCPGTMWTKSQRWKDVERTGKIKIWRMMEMGKKSKVWHKIADCHRLRSVHVNPKTRPKKVLLDSLQLFEVLFRSTTGCCLQVGGRGLLKPGESPVVWIVGGMWWLKSLEWPWLQSSTPKLRDPTAVSGPGWSTPFHLNTDWGWNVMKPHSDALGFWEGAIQC